MPLSRSSARSFYADGVGRPSLPPGPYFRMLLLGYFDGLESERAMAWRAADSLSLRQFLNIALHEAPPDHSTVSRTRRRIDIEMHEAVFTWVLRRVAVAGLLEGKTVGIYATTLEANAALRSRVRPDTGEGYDAFLRGLAAASGIPTPTRAGLARLDRNRPKKGSNDDWTHPHDPDARIAKMKDGRTRMAYTAEHAVDLETGCGRRRAGCQRGRHDHDGRDAGHGGGAGRSGAAGRQRHGRGGRGQRVPQQRVDGRAVRPGAVQLRVGARPRPAPLARQTRRPRRRVCQPAADPEASRTATAAPARRTARATQRPSL